MFLGLTFGSYFLKFGSDFGLIFYFWKVLGTLMTGHYLNVGKKEISLPLFASVDCHNFNHHIYDSG